MRSLRHHHFVRLIITAVSNKSILVAGRESKHTNLTLIIINNSIIFSVLQNEIYTIRKPFEFHTNAFQTHFIMERRNYAVKNYLYFTMGKWFDHSCFANLWCDKPTWLLSSIMYRTGQIIRGGKLSRFSRLIRQPRKFSHNHFP